ncbi:high affinity copper transporter [Amylocarpus encephaloides]|uniref:Copper transport protein n=1 Tax=Amylocarpus encephaloides TaxID=45428 RepID=A0A9P7Y9J8_9HELO|nr:high affinity copper transporter [Amylocarpus encephaloides]
MSTTTAATKAETTTMSGGHFPICKTSPLWNWYTIDACFVSDSWHITSTAMFAGSCIGVVLLVIRFAFLRRLSREYDIYNCRQHANSVPHTRTAANATYLHSNFQRSGGMGEALNPSSLSGKGEHQSEANGETGFPKHRVASFRPSLLQQLLRTVLFTLQAIVAYFIVLLAMHYNGYLFICIVLGILFGEFLFSWEVVSVKPSENTRATIDCDLFIAL